MLALCLIFLPRLRRSEINKTIVESQKNANAALARQVAEMG